MFKRFCLTIMVCLVFALVLSGLGVAVAQESEHQPITAENAAELVELMTIADINVGAIAFVPDGILLTVTDENGLHIFDVATDTLGEYLTSEPLGSLALSSDGALVAGCTISCSNGNCISNVFVLDISTGGELLSLPIEGYVDDLEFSPDGEYLGIGVSETRKETIGTTWGTFLSSGTVHLLEIKSGEDVIVATEEDAVFGRLFFSADGARLAYNTMVWSGLNPSARQGSLHAVDLETGEKQTMLQAGAFPNPPGGLTHAISADWTKAFVGGDIIWGNSMCAGQPPSIINLETDETVMPLTETYAYGVDVAFSLGILGHNSNIASSP